MRERESWESEGIERRREGEREKKNTKIWYANATVAMHICTVTVAIVHKCTILPQLMWVFFEPKCVKRLPFSILHKFTQPDVIALRTPQVQWLRLFIWGLL